MYFSSRAELVRIGAHVQCSSILSYVIGESKVATRNSIDFERYEHDLNSIIRKVVAMSE